MRRLLQNGSFDLQNDPTEMKNIYYVDEHGTLVDSLKQQLKTLKKVLDDQDKHYPGLDAVSKKYW